MLVVIRGGGDIATGIALRLHRSHMAVVICELPAPTAIRRTVSFSEAMRLGETAVEGVTARRADLEEIPALLERGEMKDIPYMMGSTAQDLGTTPQMRETGERGGLYYGCVGLSHKLEELGRKPGYV